MFPKGSLVRVLKNTSMAAKKDGSYYQPWDVIKVTSCQSKMVHDTPVTVVVFSNGRNTVFLPADEVELLESCICSAPIKAIGCKCGYEKAKNEAI